MRTGRSLVPGLVDQGVWYRRTAAAR
jgi:hypothetical protein